MESLVLALAGGMAGIALAAWGVRLLVGAAPVDLPRLGEVSVDVRVLGFAVPISLAAGGFE
jgi:putative ABC transport system permease protein